MHVTMYFAHNHTYSHSPYLEVRMYFVHSHHISPIVSSIRTQSTHEPYGNSICPLYKLLLQHYKR